MKQLLKLRWPIIVLWVALSVVLTVLLPNLNAILNERGNVMLDANYPSQAAKELMDQLSTQNGKTGILVFTNPEKLTDQNKQDIQVALQAIRDHKDALGVLDMMDIFGTPEAKDQLISSDGTTMLATFTYENRGRDYKGISEDIQSQLQNLSVTHYLTGNEFINGEYVHQIMVGVEKSAALTVGFILIVLMVIFRSAVTPFVSLATVGVSYLVSYGIVGQLVTRFGFPLSSLTQMFMILILFGIGTDYNILLFNRFKEELHNQPTVEDAIAVTYRTAGKTVLYSAITVFIAFISLQFVKFSVYRSAVAVAISVAVLLAVLYTLTPAILRLLGRRMFWPSRNAEGHKQSRLWERVTSLSVRRPYLALIAIALVLLPVLFVGSTQLTFNNLDDMGSTSAPSVVGFHTVADHFGKGKVMPATVVIRSEEAMDNNDDLAAIDLLSAKLTGLPGVVSVSGPTRPQGDEIPDFYTGRQIDQVTNGLSSANDGISQVADGLTTMHDKLTTPDFSQVDQLVSGTDSLEDGMRKITTALQQIRTGMTAGSSGAKDVSGGIETIRSNLAVISQTLNQQLSPGYGALKTGVDQWADGYRQIEQNMAGLIQLAQGTQQAVAALGDPQLQLATTNPAAYGIYTQLNGMTPQLVGALQQLDQGMKTANDSYTQKIAPNFEQLNGGLAQIAAGLPQMVDGLQQLQSGAADLSDGLKSASNGQGKIVTSMHTMTDALGKIADGQSTLAGGLGTMGDSLSKLKDGIGASRDGLNQVSDGLDKANTFLDELATTKSFYIPKEALGNADMQRAFDAYMSDDRKTAKLTVTLTDDPYSDSAVQTVTAINQMLPSALKGTALANAQVRIGGESSVTNDLKQVALSDMQLTQIIVLLSVFLVLILVTKSFWIPVYITGSILAVYYSTLSLVSVFAKAFLHTSELAWNVPFFAFLMVVTLGVDYSIFLMTRFREYRGMAPHDAIVRASANVGSVVLSAALILGGTFATIIPAGIHTLVELAIAVCLEILLLSVFFLPFVIPSLISLQDWLNRRYGFQNPTLPPNNIAG